MTWTWGGRREWTRVALWLGLDLLLVVGRACEPAAPPATYDPVPGDTVRIAYFRVGLDSSSYDSLIWAQPFAWEPDSVYALCGYVFRGDSVVARGPARCPNPPGRSVPVISIGWTVHDSTP